MLQPGDRFGDYTVKRLLGKGGMGFVFLLEDAEGGQVAAKILDPDTACDHEARRRFLREAELALGVRHPNLVEAYDVGEDPETGLCYILMEYVSGGSLADRLKAGPLAIDDAVRIVCQIASVLELARQKGIVHRDIKPANIMFGTDGKAKLADLGVARGGLGGTDTTTVTQTGMMIGTPAYMAPEQMLDAHHVDTRADIYSLGIVFYEMLAGIRPNADDTVVQLMAKAMAGEPIPDVRMMRPETSASIAELVSLMCAMDADERMQTPLEVTTAISQIMHGRKAVARQKRTVDKSTVRKRRRRLGRGWIVGISLLSLFGCVGLSAFAWWGLRLVAESSPPKTEPAKADVPVAAQPRKSDHVTDRMIRTTTCGGFRWNYWIEDGEAVISSIHDFNWKNARPAVSPKPQGRIRVPAELDGRPVGVIGCCAFATCEQLEEIDVPDTVRAVRGGSTFFRCWSLRQVNLPDSLCEIRDFGAFLECRSLSEIDLRNCSRVDASAFVNCSRLKRFRVSENNASLRVVDDMLFSRDGMVLIRCPEAKESPCLPSGVRGIGPMAFSQCRMERVDVPEGVEKIGWCGFAGCSRLQNLTLPKSLKAIGCNVFEGCRELEEVCFEGNAPRLEGRTKDPNTDKLFAQTPRTLRVSVRNGTIGWKNAGSSEMPELWPDGGEHARRLVTFGDVQKTEADVGKMIQVPTESFHRKVKPSLNSAACEMRSGDLIVIRAEAGCGMAAKLLSQQLSDRLAAAKAVFGPVVRRKDFDVAISRTKDKGVKTAEYCPLRESWQIRLPLDDDSFDYKLEELLATAFTVCYEPDWMSFSRYGMELAEARTTVRKNDRDAVNWIFRKIEEDCPNAFHKYQELKNRKFAAGEIGEEIDYDTVVDLLTTVSGRDVVALFRETGLDKHLKKAGPVGVNASKGAPPNANDGKIFDLAKMRGSSFQETLQKTLDVVFPSWRLSSDYLGQVKLMSGQIQTGRGRSGSLGYLPKTLDRENVVVFPLHFDAETEVVSCRRKMVADERLKCSVAFGHGIEKCQLVVLANGREAYRTTLDNAVQWEDFEVDLSVWKGKTTKIDVVVTCVRETLQNAGGRNSHVQCALLYVQRLEWGE